MSVTVKSPYDLRALLAKMRTAKEQGRGMAVFNTEIKAVEDAIETIEAIRSIKADNG